MTRQEIEKLLIESKGYCFIFGGHEIVEYILSGGELDEQLLSDVLQKECLLHKITELRGMITDGFPSTNTARILAISEAKRYGNIYGPLNACQAYETLRLFPDYAKDILLGRLVGMGLQPDAALVRLFYDQLDARICELMLPADADTLRLLMSKTVYSDRTFLHWMEGMQEAGDDVLALIPKHLFHEALKRLLDSVPGKMSLCECALRSINIAPETQALILGRLARYKNINTARIKVPLDLSGLSGNKLCKVLRHAKYSIVPKHRIMGLPLTEEEFRSKTLETALTDKVCYETALDSFKGLIAGGNDIVPDEDRLYSLIERIDSSNPTQTLIDRARDLNDEKVWEAIPALVQVSEDVRFNRVDRASGVYMSSVLTPAKHLIDILNKMGLPIVPGN